MRTTRVHHELPTTLEILDRVLDKGIVVETAPDLAASTHGGSNGIVLFEVDTYVEIVTDLDDGLKNAADA